MSKKLTLTEEQKDKFEILREAHKLAQSVFELKDAKAVTPDMVNGCYGILCEEDNEGTEEANLRASREMAMVLYSTDTPTAEMVFDTMEIVFGADDEDEDEEEEEEDEDEGESEEEDAV